MQNKILYISHVDGFPPGYVKNGWLADEYVRKVMSTRGLKRIKGLRDDDLFLNFDADEIPKPEVIAFLKFHDYPGDPIKLFMKHEVYGFFWWQNDGTNLVVGSSIRFLRDVCENNAICLRRNLIFNPKMMHFPGEKRIFSIGKSTLYGGHHCSWCFNAEGIRNKLINAQQNDKPRWGDYPEKLDLGYINSLIKGGEWFNGKFPFIRAKLTSAENDYAPEYIMQRKDRFKELLFHPDELKLLINEI